MDKTVLILGVASLGLYWYAKSALSRFYNGLRVQPKGITFVSPTHVQIPLTLHNTSTVSIPLLYAEGKIIFKGNVIAAFSNNFNQTIPAGSATNVVLNVFLNYQGMSSSLIAFIENIGKGVYEGLEIVGNLFTTLFKTPIPFNSKLQLLGNE